MQVNSSLEAKGRVGRVRFRLQSQVCCTMVSSGRGYVVKSMRRLNGVDVDCQFDVSMLFEVVGCVEEQSMLRVVGAMGIL